MSAKIATLSFDGFSGFFDLAKAEQQPEIDEEIAEKKTRGNWGFDYNLLAGRAQHMLRLLEDIRRKWGVNLLVTAHLAAEKLYFERISQKGEITQEGRQVAWKVDLPGQMQEQILRPFDEVWHLQIRPNAAGKPPARSLFAEPHLWSGGAGASASVAGFPFEAKTRKGVSSPLENPTYKSILAAPRKRPDFPTRILLVGVAGAGKTTLIESWPGPIQAIDMWGGCEPKGDELRVCTPQSVSDVYKALLKIRATGELL